jgi:hypothetical protein
MGGGGGGHFGIGGVLLVSLGVSRKTGELRKVPNHQSGPVFDCHLVSFSEKSDRVLRNIQTTKCRSPPLTSLEKGNQLMSHENRTTTVVLFSQELVLWSILMLIEIEMEMETSSDIPYLQPYSVVK